MRHQQISLALGIAIVAVTAGCQFRVESGRDFGDVNGPDAKAIVGGSTTTIGQHPWQISLQTPDGFHFCGGSIISDSWVLTAQHCMEGATPDQLVVVTGATKLSTATAAQHHAVDKIELYPGFTSPEHGHDATLLHLASPLSFSENVQAVALLTTNDEAQAADSPGVTATISGWGTLSSGAQSTPDGLHAVQVPIVSLQDAQAKYTQENLTLDQLAAGVNGKDSCQGDSGGPLTVSSSRGTLLAGIVSWGYGCGDPNYPGMYGRVASFASWIATKTGIDLGSSGGGTSGGGGGDNGGGSTTTGPSTTTLLSKADVSGAKGSFHHYSITVPAGAASLDVMLSGGSGDPDLYVRAGTKPTLSTWDCRPWVDGTNETCSMPNPAAGTWYVSVNGYTTYSGATVTATATVP